MKHTLDKALLPANENERLEKLYGYNIVNNHDKVGTFQHVVSMAARIFNVAIAVVSFVDEKSVHIDANVGMAGTSEICRDISLCSLAILKDKVTVFENAREELCLLSNPMVHSEYGIQFYAGAPLKTPEGLYIGVLALADKKPRAFSIDEEKLLEGLAAIVMEELEDKLYLSKA